MNEKELVRMARQAQQQAYAPYSHFFVGAALLCEDGSIYTGCNIENSSFTPTCCAERVAFFQAVKEGKRAFSAIAIVGGKEGKRDKICPPCGVCRQVMTEFCWKDFKIILADAQDNVTVLTLEELLPYGFLLEE